MKKKLLLADDSITIQKVIQITFSHDDYVMTVVDNGDAALEKARSEHPDLILADVFMPGKNGYELCAAVKQDPALSATPVLLLTGTFEPFDEAKARSVGANKWISKPFESQSLIACVEELLAARGTVAPSAPPAQPVVPVPPPVAPVPVASPVAVAAVAPVAESVAVQTPELPPVADDIWNDNFLSAPLDVDQTGVAPLPPLEGVGDLWDAGSFDSSAQTLEPAPAGDDLWGSFDGQTEMLAEEALPLTTEEITVDEDMWGGAGDFSSSFESAPLDATASAGFGLIGTSQDELSLVSDVEILEEVELAGDAFGVMPQGSELVAEETVFFSPEALKPEPVMTEKDPFATDLGTVVSAAPIIPAPVAPPTSSPAPVVDSSSVSQQLSNLSEADLEKVVEKVAGVVVERLAGAILEKIAWEVVPELAETLIKEEIRKIRDEAAA